MRFILLKESCFWCPWILLKIDWRSTGHNYTFHCDKSYFISFTYNINQTERVKNSQSQNRPKGAGWFDLKKWIQICYKLIILMPNIRHLQMTWHNRPCHKLLMYVNIYSSVFLSSMFKILNLHKQITNNISFFTCILTNSKSFNLFKPFYVIQTRFAWFESMIKCTWFDIKFFSRSKFT